MTTVRGVSKTSRFKKPVHKAIKRRRRAIAKKQLADEVAREKDLEKNPKKRIPKGPGFLRCSPRVRQQGLDRMMKNWAEFVKVPLTMLTEQELKAYLSVEMNTSRRWAFVNRLHMAYSTKRKARERAAYRKRCGLEV